MENQAQDLDHENREENDKTQQNQGMVPDEEMEGSDADIDRGGNASQEDINQSENDGDMSEDDMNLDADDYETEGERDE